ncbi:hypothetical protein F7Q99_31170 [Streptomyces kaniharaensis]|uniref:Uncharacterized protein n=1 Tax=Streptomyces kaniharaensis TaxID=212423 RepID=A0A6N7L3U2_9ACTN|nr:hypothetical protein [Streptomyces kaniharaensis]MQS16533.1 hypothetical protein [Streptomyces kaniharaensis]
MSDPEEESAWVVTLPDELRDGLADAPSRRLAELAVPWSAADDGYGDPAHLTAFLEQLAARPGEPGHTATRAAVWPSGGGLS